MMVFLICSYVVGDIYIDVKDVYDDPKGIHRILSFFHVKTKRFVILNAMPFRKGDIIEDTLILKDLKARLLRKDIFYYVEVSYKLRGDTMDIYVKARDKLTFGVYSNVEGSGKDIRIDFGVSERNFLGTGTFILGYVKYSRQRSGVSGDFFSNPWKNIYVGGYASYDNLYRRFGGYYFKPYWRNIRGWGFGGGIHYYSDSTGRSRLSASSRISYNFTPNITAFGIGINMQASPTTFFTIPFLDIQLSNRTYGFIRNVDDLTVEEFFPKGSELNLNLSYGRYTLQLLLSTITDNLVSSFNVELNDDPLAREVKYAWKLYYKPTNFLTLAFMLSSDYLDIRDTTSYLGLEVGGFLGIRGLNYYYGFSDHINRFVAELRLYSPEMFKLLALGGVLFYDYAEFGEEVWVAGIGIRFKLTRFAMPVMRLDYGCNTEYCIASFGSSQPF